MRRKSDGQEIYIKRQGVETCWLTSTVRQAVEDVAFMTEALETAGRVDTKVVTGAVKRALVNVCIDGKT